MNKLNDKPIYVIKNSDTLVVVRHLNDFDNFHKIESKLELTCTVLKTGNYQFVCFNDVEPAPTHLIVAARLKNELGDSTLICETCGGTGETMQMVCYGNNPIEKIVMCPDCNGEGVIVDER